jgi:hypothetical protein
MKLKPIPVTSLGTLEVTVEVTGLKKFAVQMMLFTLFLKVGSWFLPKNVELKVVTGEQIQPQIQT